MPAKPVTLRQVVLEALEQHAHRVKTFAIIFPAGSNHGFQVLVQPRKSTMDYDLGEALSQIDIDLAKVFRPLYIDVQQVPTLDDIGESYEGRILDYFEFGEGPH